jgi:hypothetical protein
MPEPLRYALVSVGVLALVAFSWSAFRHAGRPSPLVQLVGYRVVDDTALEVRFEVERAVTTTTTCVAIGYDADHVNVGTTVLVLRAGEQGAGQLVRTMRTKRRAATAVLDSCSP